MVGFGYSIDKKITDVLKTKKFTVSAEIVPPRNGEDQTATMGKLQEIIGSGVDFLSVTKGAGGSLRGGSLPMAQAIKEHFSKPCIAHFTCRDLIPAEIENQLMDHHYFGIRNILALRGDPPMGVTDWQPREGGYTLAHQLIKHIVQMNQGQFTKREGFDVRTLEKTDFCIGAAVYPEHPDAQERVSFTKIKFEQGAEYGITQMLFDDQAFGKFMDDIGRAGVKAPILPGLRVIKSKKQADVMQTRFQCHVPDWYRQHLPEENQPDSDQFMEAFYLLIEKLRALGAPGVHLFVLSDTAINSGAIKHLTQSKGSV